MNSARLDEPGEIRAREDNSNVRYVPNADVISLETVVHMMVDKGICTAEELFKLEGRVQELSKKKNNENYVSIHNFHDRGRFPAFKRTMSQFRWGRRLGTLLFGWKWKKVKKDQSLQ